MVDTQLVKITNMVVVAKLGVRVDLHHVIQHLVNAKYHPKRFSAIVWNHRKIKGVCLLFSSGHIQCSGYKDMKDARQAVRQYSRIIQRIGYQVRLTRIELKTASALVDLGMPVDLSKIPPTIPQASYEPELMNSAMFKIGSMSFTVFQSGRCVVCGIRKYSHISTIILPACMELLLCV